MGEMPPGTCVEVEQMTPCPPRRRLERLAGDLMRMTAGINHCTMILDDIRRIEQEQQEGREE